MKKIMYNGKGETNYKYFLLAILPKLLDGKIDLWEEATKYNLNLLNIGETFYRFLHNSESSGQNILLYHA